MRPGRAGRKTGQIGIPLEVRSVDYDLNCITVRSFGAGHGGKYVGGIHFDFAGRQIRSRLSRERKLEREPEVDPYPSSAGAGGFDCNHGKDCV